jgi:hypothetical protein
MKIGDLVQWVYDPPATAEGLVGVVVHVYTSPADPVGAGASTRIDVMWEDGVYTLLAGHVEVINDNR